jgi:probable selenium-dependent hydroxylase accessory protein YqeC
LTAGLLAALGLGRSQVVALVGAGGKTSLAAALAAEARAAGLRTLVTSTTKRMGGRGGPEAGPLVLDSVEDALGRLEAALALHGWVTFLGERQREGKLVGVSAARVDAIRGLAELVLVEADGARGRSLKMPAPHEPVLPASTTLMVVLAGLDVLGAPLDAENVHRLDRVVAALGREAGTVLDESALAAVLAHPTGYLSRVPVGAGSAAFLNKAEDAAAEAAAVRVAAQLAHCYDLVACGSARQGTARRL